MIVRLCWLALGPSALMVLSILKLEAGPADTGLLDRVFAANVALLMLVRWAAYLAGDRYDSLGVRTGLNGPLTFSGLVCISAGVLWGLVTLIASQRFVG